MLKLNNVNMKWILVIITILGIVFRLIGFGMLPAGLNRDEAALGYNAFSLLQSGKDEWGISWPIVFRSFGDYKLAGYIYALIPFITVFGNTAFAVRLPSLFAGIVLIPLIYLFTQALVKRKDVALVSAGIQAISPWALHYSKIGFEANVALMLFVASLYAFIEMNVMNIQIKTWIASWGVWHTLDKKNSVLIYQIFGLVCIFLSLLTYNAPLVLVPSIFLILLGMKKYALAIGVGIVSICAFLLVFPATKGKTGITVFTDIGVVEQQHLAYQEAQGSLIKRVFASPVFFYPRVVAIQYIKSFNPAFLVFRGGSNPWHQAPKSGHVTLGIFSLFMLGIFSAGFLFKKQSILLYVFLLIGPLASSITVDAPQATRMLFFFFMISIFAAVGVLALWKYAKVVALLACFIVLIESLQYQYHAFQSFSTKPQEEWYSGMYEVLQKAEFYRKQGETIGMVGDAHYMYIYPAFYMSILPSEFRTTIEYFPNDLIGLSQVKKVGHYLFASSTHDLQNATIVIEQRDGLLHVDRSKQ